MKNMVRNRRRNNMGEKIYKVMRNIGIGNVVLGIIILVVGITTGILAIVGGARLIKNKSEIIF